MFSRGIIIALITVVTIAGVLFATRKNFDIIKYQKCDTAGDSCCAPDSEVKTQHCHQSLGCNITTNKCEACGKPGQPCCDGDLTGFSLKGYSGFLLDSKERIESCDAGSACDAQLAADGKSWDGSRTCKACGMKDGGACCAPDVRYALGRCFTDSVSKKRLTCSDPWAGDKGTCISCGSMAGEVACMDRRPCGEDRLTEKDGICVFCGEVGQPVCEVGEPCYGQSVPNNTYSICIAAGGKDQPCLKDRRCGYHGMICDAKKICRTCGNGGEICCPPSTGDPDCQVGECVEGKCFICGYENNPVCPGNDPCPGGGEPVNGFCRACGNAGQVCCRANASIRCHDGMLCRDNVCKGPSGGGAAGGGEQWKTCSGQPYTWSTQAITIFVEDENKCIFNAPFTASSPEEALQCARGQYGEDAIGPTVNQFQFAATCPGTGCNTVYYSGRNQSSVKECVEFVYSTCEVEDGAC